MRRLALYSIVVSLLGMASLAVADLAIVTDEERIEDMLHEVAGSSSKVQTILRHIDLERAPLEVRIGRIVSRYEPEEYEGLAAAAAQLDADIGARRVEVRQSEIDVQDGTAQVIANFVGESDGASIQTLACEANLRKVGQRWIVERIHVMD